MRIATTTFLLFLICHAQAQTNILPPAATRLSAPMQAAPVSVTLPAFDADAARGAAPISPLRIGEHRFPDDQSDLAPRLNWRTLEDGTAVAVFTVHSPGAASLRLRLRAVLPEGAQMRFFSPDALGKERHGIGGLQDTDALWTPSVGGDVLGVELSLPSVPAVGDVEIRILRVAHRWMRLSSALSPAIHACPGHIDHPCGSPGLNVGDAGDAVGALLFESDGGTSVCSGALVRADGGGAPPPYMLTAHHCIKDAEVAATLQALFLYRKTAANCESDSDHPTPPPEETRSYVGGADLLRTSPAQDTTFLRLRRAPPNGVSYATFRSAPMRVGEDVEVLSHPGFSVRKYAHGVVDALAPFTLDNGLNVENGVIVRLSQGATEGGSSGGPLLSRGEVAGVLSGGSDCGSPHTAFGNFSDFLPQVAQWLRPSGGGGERPSAGAHDLAVHHLRADKDRIGAGETLRMAASVENAGTAGSPLTHAYLLFAFGDRDEVRGLDYRIPPLDPDGSHTLRFPVRAPTEAGAWHFRLCVQTKDYDETNDCAAKYDVQVVRPGTSPAGAAGPSYNVPLFWAADSAEHEGVLHLRNLTGKTLSARITARDVNGLEGLLVFERTFLPYEKQTFAATDLFGLFNLSGNLSLRIESPYRIEALSYVRSRGGGFMTPMQPAAKSFNGAGSHHLPWLAYVPTLRSGRFSYLWVSNPQDISVQFVAYGENGAGMQGDAGCVAEGGAGGAFVISAQRMEDVCLGPASGDWSLFLTSDRRLDVYSLHYSNAGGVWVNMTGRGQDSRGALDGTAMADKRTGVSGRQDSVMSRFSTKMRPMSGEVIAH